MYINTINLCLLYITNCCDYSQSSTKNTRHKVQLHVPLDVLFESVGSTKNILADGAFSNFTLDKPVNMIICAKFQKYLTLCNLKVKLRD